MLAKKNHFKHLQILILFFILFSDLALAFNKIRTVYYFIDIDRPSLQDQKSALDDAIEKRLANSSIIVLLPAENPADILNKIASTVDELPETKNAIRFGEEYHSEKCFFVLAFSGDRGLSLEGRLYDVSRRQLDFATSLFFVADTANVEQAIDRFIEKIEIVVPIFPLMTSISDDSLSAEIDCGWNQGMKNGTIYNVNERMADGILQRIGSVRITSVTEEKAVVEIIQKDRPLGLNNVLTFYNTNDTTAPEIKPVPITICTYKQNSKFINNVEDNQSGVASVYLWYKNSFDDEMTKMLMDHRAENVYEATLPAYRVFGKKILYYYSAVDSMNNSGENKSLNARLYEAEVQSPDKENPRIDRTLGTRNKDTWHILVNATDNADVHRVKMSCTFGKKKENPIETNLVMNKEKMWEVVVPIPQKTDKKILNAKVTAFDMSGNFTETEYTIKSKSKMKWVWIGLGGGILGGAAAALLLPDKPPAKIDKLPEPPPLP